MATLFERIISREIPANILFETDRALAFSDISPVAPTHVLIIPKKPITKLSDCTDEDEALLGHLMLVARDVAKQLGVSEGGFRLVTNNGEGAGQSVPHLHFHLIAGRTLSWPPG